MPIRAGLTISAHPALVKPTVYLGSRVLGLRREFSTEEDVLSRTGTERESCRVHVVSLVSIALVRSYIRPTVGYLEQLLVEK